MAGQARARAVWDWLAREISDGPDNTNNRFAVAARINATFPEGPGPFWSHPTGQSWPGLPFRRTGIDYAALGLSETRAAEAAVQRSQAALAELETSAALYEVRAARAGWIEALPYKLGERPPAGAPVVVLLAEGTPQQILDQVGLSTFAIDGAPASAVAEIGQLPGVELTRMR